MTLKTDRNVIGRQITTEVDEVVTAIRIATDSIRGWTFVLPTTFTTAQLNELFVKAPTVTGSGAAAKTIDATGCTGFAALTSGDKLVITNKGYALTAPPG